jgi:hypothetical protein
MFDFTINDVLQHKRWFIIGGIALVCFLVLPLNCLSAVSNIAEALKPMTKSQALRRAERISFALSFYMYNHDERYPLPHNWHKAVKPVIRDRKLLKPMRLRGGKASYALFDGIAGWQQTEIASAVPLLFTSGNLKASPSGALHDMTFPFDGIGIIDPTHGEAVEVLEADAAAYDWDPTPKSPHEVYNIDRQGQ